MTDGTCVSLTFHAERLDDERVWAHTKSALERLARKQVRCTLFVFPLHAQVASFELGPRLDWLVAHGHEIGQHTHFYRRTGEPGAPVAFVKESVVTPDVVERALADDFAYLASRGHRPRGFVAGAWTLVDDAFRWLADRGFAYDCSFRGAGTPDSVAGMVEIPTTMTLKQALSPGAFAATAGVQVHGRAFHHIYLHDYDLLSATKRLALFSLTERLARAGATPVVEHLARLRP